MFGVDDSKIILGLLGLCGSFLLAFFKHLYTKSTKNTSNINTLLTYGKQNFSELKNVKDIADESVGKLVEHGSEIRNIKESLNRLHDKHNYKDH